MGALGGSAGAGGMLQKILDPLSLFSGQGTPSLSAPQTPPAGGGGAVQPFHLLGAFQKPQGPTRLGQIPLY